MKKQKKRLNDQLCKDYAVAAKDPERKKVIEEWSVLDFEGWPENGEKDKALWVAYAESDNDPDTQEVLKDWSVLDAESCSEV